MSKKNNYAGSHVITVHQFMEMCGIQRERRMNERISHAAMCKKLESRAKKFPDAVWVPVRVPFRMVRKEDVAVGETLLVEDDYEVLMPYKKPIMMRVYESEYTEAEREKIRQMFIDSELAKEEEELTGFTPGYMKYLFKKEKRDQEAEQQFLEDLLEQDRIDQEAGFTEDQVKSRVKRKSY